MSKNDRIMRIVMSVVLVVAMVLWAREAASLRTEYAWTLKTEATYENAKWCVVLDAGHGGKDPGKIGITGCYEKDINLKIVEKLKIFLEMEGIEVILTRDGDYGLYQETDPNKKSADMRNRAKLIEDSKADVMLSIHQNSYTDESINGAQVFYYGGSTEGKQMAKCVQESMVATLDKDNHRKEKASDGYYLLKNSACPGVIVECAFLSNEKECRLMETEYYQEKVAWAIFMGIMQYLNTK